MAEKYVVVYWVEENKYGITRERFVKDRRMLCDDQRVGLVEYGSADMKPPKGGWPSYPARVLAASGTF